MSQSLTSNRAPQSPKNHREAWAGEARKQEKMLYERRLGRCRTRGGGQRPSFMPTWQWCLPAGFGPVMATANHSGYCPILSVLSWQRPSQRFLLGPILQGFGLLWRRPIMACFYVSFAAPALCLRASAHRGGDPFQLHLTPTTPGHLKNPSIIMLNVILVGQVSWQPPPSAPLTCTTLPPFWKTHPLHPPPLTTYYHYLPAFIFRCSPPFQSTSVLMPHLYPLATVPSVSGREARKKELMTPERLVAIASAGEWNKHRRNTTPPQHYCRKAWIPFLMLWLLFVFEGAKEMSVL